MLRHKFLMFIVGYNYSPQLIFYQQPFHSTIDIPKNKINNQIQQQPSKSQSQPIFTKYCHNTDSKNNNQKMQESNPLKTLQILMQNNQALIANKSADIIAKLSTYLHDYGQLDFQKQINIPDVLDYLRSVNMEQYDPISQEEQDEINRELIEELQGQHAELEHQVRNLELQVQESNARRTNYQMAQKHITSRILKIEDSTLNTHLRALSHSIPHFVYEQTSNGLQFQESFKKIADHFLHRVHQNEAILQSLENLVKGKVKETEQKRVKVNHLLSVRQQAEQAKLKAKHLSQVNESLKKELYKKLEVLEQQIDARLPGFLDASVSRLKSEKEQYERAYLGLTEILNRVVGTTQTQKLGDYI